MTRIAKVATAAAAGIGLAVSLFAASPAYAGSNGQQILFCGFPQSVSSGLVTGTNHRNQSTWAEQFFGATGPADGCRQLPNNWWKDTVTIQWRAAGTVVKTTSCWVPTQQSGSDWTRCYY
ncbi:hypothetical protein OG889_31870 [Streptomyces sp. NBC_00481]|uniref:hypothetical protein n=1 Tax=unclassified Streptomyces TaxID=2593676 RepID=UPI002DD81B3B|nr:MULTISPECIES: hypothetical protein [unclassified Streptomyces]WRY98883.1 hypothetical protein OG889_31870 [Streptomyces sp. NBC_00481]